MKLSKILGLNTKDDVNQFLDSIGSANLDDSNITESNLEGFWEYVGGNDQNASVIDMLENGEKGIIERLTNGIDAVLEKKKIEYNLGMPKKSEQIVKAAFPKFYNHYKGVLSGNKNGNQAYDAADYVTLAVNDGSKKNTPTFDIVDLGVGIEGKRFSSTILSLHGGNKVKKDTSYLIGAFGQGGSTSLSFAYATLIISKLNNKYYFTIVKKSHLKDFKNHAYFYLANNSEIMEVENDIDEPLNDNYLNDFLNSSSGTLIRMIDLEISKRYRERDIAKPRMLGDYFNIELYGTPFPIRMVENRTYFKEETEHHQNRYVYGTKLKLKTWKKYVSDKYSGFIEIVHNGHTYKIEFFTILPSEKSEWINDNKCRETYEMFNIHEKPIFFTVNGQYINGEYFTKLANRGLSFLKYRVLVHIDLDMLDNEKYQFFTTDRSRIKDSDLTSGFIDKVIKELSENRQLIEINEIIAEMSIEKGLDKEALEALKNDVKSAYEEFLNPRKRNKGFNPDPKPKPQPSNEILNDFINDLIITNTKNEYFSDESIRIILKTDAYKDVNEVADIKAYIKGKEFYLDNKSVMNGRIQYVIDTLKPGEYDLRFIYFYGDNNMIQSNLYNFNVLDEVKGNEPKGQNTDLDLNIEYVKQSEVIVFVAKNLEQKRIDIKLCLSHEELTDVYVGKKENEVTELKHKIAKPICLMALYSGDLYDNLEPEKQNKLIKSLVSTIDRGL